MFKEHATIVDTPGIGESEEMTNILVNYLPEAVAFIYVINTANAGGVQDDRVWCHRTHAHTQTEWKTKIERERESLIRIMSKLIYIDIINVQFRLYWLFYQLVKLFAKQLELQKKGRLWEFDPESAIFVCNKWDQVSKDEEGKVWEHIVQKLKSNWPTRKNTKITNQIFKMSVKEVTIEEKNGILSIVGQCMMVYNILPNLLPVLWWCPQRTRFLVKERRIIANKKWKSFWIAFGRFSPQKGFHLNRYKENKPLRPSSFDSFYCEPLFISEGTPEKTNRLGLHWDVPVPYVGHWSSYQCKPGAQGHAAHKVTHISITDVFNEIFNEVVLKTVKYSTFQSFIYWLSFIFWVIKKFYYPKGNVLSYRWQQTFLDSILIKVIAKHNASKKNQEEKMEFKAEVEKALKTLENEAGHVSIQTFRKKQSPFC